MPIFQYKGYRSDGAKISGTLEADGLKDAVSRVKELGFFPKEVKEFIQSQKRFLSRPKDNLLPLTTRQLSTMLSSGVPLLEALRALSEEHKGYWKGVLISTKERISGGVSFSRALEDYPKTFPEFYRNMVAAGEASGTLERILERLADFLENQANVKAKVRMSLIYPTFMASIVIIVMSFLFTFVIPKIVKIFENTKSALPLITNILIDISNLFHYYWWVLLIMIVGGSFMARRLITGHRLFIDRVMLKLPGNVVQTLYFARFSRTLSFLLQGGLPMLRALELSAKSIGNLVLQNKVMDASKKVSEGASLSVSLSGFPPVLIQMISTGERGGRLAEVLNRAGDSCEEEFGRKVQKTLSLLEPLMILFMGLVVGFIVLAVLLPMFQLNQLVR
ncbi:MAG: type II secretion system F family protein [Nitrospirota bacterium]